MNPTAPYSHQKIAETLSGKDLRGLSIGLQEQGTGYNLCTGMPGPAWTLAHLARHGFFEADVDDTLGELATV